MRKYLALLDNGHDYSEFLYYSEHRAKSKANADDLFAALRRERGRYASRWQIVTVQIYDCD